MPGTDRPQPQDVGPVTRGWGGAMRAGAGCRDLDPCLASAVTRRQRQQQQRRRPNPALTPRTGDESARFHSKELPGPPPRSTSGFTGLLRLPFPDGQLETTGSQAGVQKERSEQTVRAAGRLLSLLDCEVGVRARASRAPRRLLFLPPPLNSPATAEMWDGGTPSPGGDWLGNGTVSIAKPRSPFVLVFTTITALLKN
ncbi:uncharacterized protein LOC104649919 [Saimiri boliviensis]|uniref:uncharacterized protein LOC104649919 n=1 Tax=Saimiri boliviensis TaxID=27679 RepID=UPI003D7799C1